MILGAYRLRTLEEKFNRERCRGKVQ